MNNVNSNDGDPYGFPQRLSQACDNCPDCPPKGKGRQKWVAQVCGKSDEASRKWFSGLSRPKLKTSEKLARALNVDSAWLMLGVEPEFIKSSDKMEFRKKLDGSVYMVFGAMMRDGYACAFDSEKSQTHFHAIKDGVQQTFYVAVAEQSGDSFQVMIPSDTPDAEIIAFIPLGYCEAELINIDQQAIDKHGKKQGLKTTMRIRKKEGAYYTGNKRLKQAI